MREVALPSTRRPWCRSGRRCCASTAIRALDDHPGRRGGQAERQPVRAEHPRAARRLHRWSADPVLRHEVQRWGAVGRRGRAPTDHTVLSGPAAGALGAALIARRAGFDRVLTCDGGGTSSTSRSCSTVSRRSPHRGDGRRYPSKIPMIDVVTVGAGGARSHEVTPEGTLKVGPQSAGADPGPLCYGKGGTEPTITDAHVVLGRILLTCSVARSRSTWMPRALASVTSPPASGSTNGAPPASSRSPRGTRRTPFVRVSVKRGLDVRELHADHLRRVGVAARVARRHPRPRRGRRAAEPRERVGVRAAHRRRQERLRADPRGQHLG